MATTDTGFQFAYNLAGRTTGIQQTFLIEDSGTITIGDMVRGSYDSAAGPGMIELVGAGNPILGVVVGIVNEDGIDMNNSKQSITGTWTDSTKTYAAAGSNETVDKIKAVVDVDPFSIWTATPDSAAIGNTTSSGSSDQLGSFTDIVSASDQPDENNAANAYNTVAQLFIWGLNPENTAKGLYSIAEHQMWGQ